MMLVDINLLPQKETKNKTLLVFTIILVAILLLGVFVIFWLYRGYDNQLMDINQRIASTEAVISTEQQKQLASKESNSVDQLKRTVEWAKAFPLKTVPILDKVSSLLPDRGFIKTFKYKDPGIIVLTVQFDESKEAAYYLSSLLDSKWISNAKINSLKAVNEFYDKKMNANYDENHIKNEKYIPRYEGEFEITLNQTVIKNEVHHQNTALDSFGKKDGEGS